MTPPRLARWLVRLAAAREDRAFVLSDLEEELSRQVTERGDRAARRWYWRQAVTSVVPLLVSQVRTVPCVARVPLLTADDWRQAVRWIGRRPRASTAAVLTLAIALGATGAAAVIVHGLVLRPLPYPDESRVVHLWPVDPNAGPRPSRAAIPVSSLQDVDDWRRAASTTSAISAYVETTYTLTGAGRAQRVVAMRVGPTFDAVLGIVPAAGRAFGEADFRPGSEHVVMLTHRFWQRVFGGDRAAIGQSLRLDDRVFEIVGVLPDLEVPFPSSAHELWVPLIAQPGVFWQNQRGTGWVTAVARVKPDVSREAAEQELSGIARDLRERYPSSNRHRTAIALEPVREAIAGDVRPIVLLIASAIAAVLLVACGNLINLLLAQAEERRRELAVRLALGAAGTRLRGQILCESLLLVSAGATGCALAVPQLIRAFVAVYPDPLPVALLSPGFALAPFVPIVLAAATLVLALPQMAQGRRLDVTATLRGARQTGGRSGRRTREGLVAAQVAFSVALLAAGIAFVRTSAALATTDPGFRAERVLVFSLVPPASRYGAAGARSAYYDRVLTAIESVPGVESAAMAVGVPFVSSGWSFPVVPRGGTEADRVLVRANMTSTRYYETLGIPLMHGRWLSDAEQRSDAHVVLISESAVRLLPDPSRPIGQRIPYSGSTWEIAGVVGDVRDRGLHREGAPAFIMPWSQAGPRPQTVALRTSGDPLLVVPAIRARLAEIDPLVPMADVERLSDVVAETTADERFRAVLVAALAGVAMLLAALGVYSVTAYAVAQRAREYGVRLALGEAPGALAWRVVRSSLKPAIAGAVIGLAAAWYGAAALQQFMFGIEARDPRALALVAFALLTVAVLAAVAPARRAARVDPATALRAE